MLRAAAGRVSRTVCTRWYGAAASEGAAVEWSPEVTSSKDPWEVQYYMRVDMLLNEVLKVPKAEQAAFKKKFEISQGNWTLEWCHPSPVPFHTYEELPIIKEFQ